MKLSAPQALVLKRMIGGWDLYWSEYYGYRMQELEGNEASVRVDVATALQKKGLIGSYPTSSGTMFALTTVGREAAKDLE